MNSRETWADAAYEILVEVAGRYHGIIEYGHLGEEIKQRTGVHTRMGIQNWIGPVLELVVQRCAREGIPHLTSLVVRKESGMVGEGYDAVLRAEGIPPLEDTMQREHHAADSRLLCYQWAHALDLPAGGGRPALAPKLARSVARKNRLARDEAARPTCPTCNLELTPSGICDNCS